LDGTTAVDAEEAEPVPDTFVAVTVNEYEVPLTRPETVHDVDVVVQENEPEVELTVYRVIAAPPVAGAVHDTSTEESNAPVATTAVGASGTVEGTTAADPAEAEPVPDTFVAATVNEYETPFVRPVTVHEVEAVVHENDPEVEDTV